MAIENINNIANDEIKNNNPYFSHMAKYDPHKKGLIKTNQEVRNKTRFYQESQFSPILAILH